MPAEDHIRQTVELKFLAAVSLRFETPQAIGETPEGVRFHFTLQGTVHGPELEGKFPRCTAYLLIDPDGIGTIQVRAPLLLHDGAVAELEATGRYDFGSDGYQRAVAKDLPNSALGWCPRFLTGDARYQWLNRVQCVGVGELRPRESSVNYDLFAMAAGPRSNGPRAMMTPSSSGGAMTSRASAETMPATAAHPSLYERLGGKPVVDAIASDFVDALVDNVQLNRQNPKVAVKHAAARGEGRAKTAQVAGRLFCKLTGGPCEFTPSRPMKELHAPLDITESDWAIMREALDRVLMKHRVRKRERDELFAIIEGTKADIVTGTVSRN
jgi:hemoglobin